MHEWLSGKEAVEIKEPTDEGLELARTYFDNGVRLYESI